MALGPYTPLIFYQKKFKKTFFENDLKFFIFIKKYFKNLIDILKSEFIIKKRKKKGSLSRKRDSFV